MPLVQDQSLDLLTSSPAPTTEPHSPNPANKATQRTTPPACVTKKQVWRQPHMAACYLSHPAAGPVYTCWRNNTPTVPLYLLPNDLFIPFHRILLVVWTYLVPNTLEYPNTDTVPKD